VRRVYGSFDLVAVHHARNLLESSGIGSVVRNEILSSAAGELPPADCQIELWVLSDSDAPRAEALLRCGGGPARGAPWRCEGCGEASEAQFTQCWRCGTARRA
jgi:hypothetical protein